MPTRLYRECPNCPAIWGEEEIALQTCSACGFPDHEEEVDEFDNFFPDEHS